MTIFQTSNNNLNFTKGETVLCEVKLKFALEQGMKAHRRNRGIALLFL
jgi:hypothetical protein